uniref:Uncharacterized protein n=1 Tax=Micrurus lemniscatus lemniscatus TaxID=129467 RepID=A0A2D4ITU4_MICLE
MCCYRKTLVVYGNKRKGNAKINSIPCYLCTYPNIFYYGFLTEDLPPSITLTNANLLMTTNGQVLAFRNSLVPRQVLDQPSTLLQAKVKSETVGNDEKEQSGKMENN